MPIGALISIVPSLLLTAGAVAAAILFLALRRENIEMRRRIAVLERTSANAVGPLADRLREMEDRLRVVEARPSQPGLTTRTGLNLNSRAQALRMLRRGTPAETVAATLHLARPEVELLVRVQQLEQAAESITSEIPG
jgi:hypothetical protein